MKVQINLLHYTLQWMVERLFKKQGRPRKLNRLNKNAFKKTRFIELGMGDKDLSAINQSQINNNAFQQIA